MTSLGSLCRRLPSAILLLRLPRSPTSELAKASSLLCSLRRCRTAMTLQPPRSLSHKEVDQPPPMTSRTLLRVDESSCAAVGAVAATMAAVAPVVVVAEVAAVAMVAVAAVAAATAM